METITLPDLIRNSGNIHNSIPAVDTNFPHPSSHPPPATPCWIMPLFDWLIQNWVPPFDRPREKYAVAASVYREAAMDSEQRCEDTSGMLAGFGLDVKPLRMVSSPSNVGARHTIDNILGLARRGNGKEEGERAATPENAESAGKRPGNKNAENFNDKRLQSNTFYNCKHIPVII